MEEETQLTIEELAEKLRQAEAKAGENLAGWQRATADYANLQKENEKREGKIFEIANASFMSEVLPVYGYFKMAMDHIPPDQGDLDWAKGIGFIQKQFQEFLKKYGIEEIKTVGEKFDPQFHEAIAHEEKEGFETDVIFEEAGSGWLINGQVLNPAKVKVAK